MHCSIRKNVLPAASITLGSNLPFAAKCFNRSSGPRSLPLPCQLRDVPQPSCCQVRPASGSRRRAARRPKARRRSYLCPLVHHGPRETGETRKLLPFAEASAALGLATRPRSDVLYASHAHPTDQPSRLHPPNRQPKAGADDGRAPCALFTGPALALIPPGGRTPTAALPTPYRRLADTPFRPQPSLRSRLKRLDVSQRPPPIFCTSL